MKKYLFIAAAATLSLAACTSDDDAENSWNNEIQLTSSIASDGTRAATDIQGSQFDKGENIDVYISEVVADGETATTTYGDNGKLMCTTSNASGSISLPAGTCFPASGNAVEIYAVYPTGALDGNFTVQTDQTTDEAYKKSDLMFGQPLNNPIERTKDKILLNFQHEMTKITVKLTSGNGNPDLEGAEVSLLNVKPTTKLSLSRGDLSSGWTIDAMPDNPSGDPVDIKILKVTDTETEGSCIVPPYQTLSKLCVKLANGTCLYADVNNVGRILQVYQNYVFDITVNFTSITLTSNRIMDWWNGGTTIADAEME